MKVFSTNLALTRGIYEVEASETSQPHMVEVKTSNYPMYLHGEGRDWHRTLESAKARAEAMRTAKIKSLKASISRLESLNFDSVKNK